MGRCEGFALGKPLMKQGIDLFCGIGGSSAGAELAGFEITWACNHDPVAINVHELNHPNTTHACEDALLTNYFDDVPDCDFMLASPACQGHSTASQPKRRRYHEESRASAWAVIQAIDAKRPSTASLRTHQGSLDGMATMLGPMPSRASATTFRHICSTLRTLEFRS